MSSKFLSDEEFMGGSAASSGTLLSDDEFMGGAPAEQAAKPADAGSLPSEIGKGVAAGAVSTVGTMLKGASTQTTHFTVQSATPAQREIMDRIDRGEDVKPIDVPPEDRTFTAKYRDLPPRIRQDARAHENEDFRESPIFKAGEATQAFATRQFPAAKDYEDSWTRAIAEGLGSTVPFLAASAIPGAGGIAVGSAAGSFASSGQQIDDAIKHGATKEQILKAVKLGGLPGLAEQLPIETLFERIPLPLYGRMAGAIGKVLGQAAAEGGQEMVQQVAQNLIAKYVYNPDQDISEGVLQAGAIGGIVGGGLKVVEPHTYRKGEAAAKAQTPEASINIPQGAADAETLFGQESAGGNADIPADTAAGGPPPPPAVTSTDVERERPDSPRLTSEDRASPLPNNLIDDGKKIFEEALGSGEKTKSAEPLDGQIITPAQQREAAQRVADIAGEFGTPASQAAAPALEHTIEGTTAAAEPVSSPVAAPARPLSDREFIEGISAIDDAAHAAATSPANDLAEPTQAMKEAGNYKKGKIRIADLDISVENPKGSVRSGTAPDGSTWETTLPAHYGYITGVAARSPDKEHVDVYVGEDLQSPRAYIVNQVDPQTGKFDEAKIVLGAKNSASAITLYDQGFSDGSGPQRRDSAIEMPVADLKEYLNTHGFKLPARPSSAAGRIALELPPRTVAPARVSGVEGDEVAVPQPEREGVRELRRQRDSDLPGVDGRLRGVLPSDGAKADAEAHAGANRQQSRLQPDKLRVGDATAAKPEQTRQSPADASKPDDAASQVGGRTGHHAVDDKETAGSRMVGGKDPEHRQNESAPDAKARATDNAGRRDASDKRMGKAAQRDAEPDHVSSQPRADAATSSGGREPTGERSDREVRPREPVADQRDDFTEDDIPAFLKKDKAKADTQARSERQDELFALKGGPDLTPGGGSKQFKLGDTTIDYGVSRDGETAEIILVSTPRAKRGEGSARSALSELLRAFDGASITTFLTVEPRDSGTSKGRLVEFYKSLGFRENKGRRKDFRAQNSMVREPKGERFKLTPTDAFSAQAQDVGTRLRAELDRLGLKDTGLRISENLGLMVEGKMHAADGSYFQKLISISLDADNPDSVLDHEAIHALRDVGAFSKDEWAILERKSRKEWRDRYAIAESYGSFPDVVQTEEGIAHAYADWRAGRSMDGIIAKAFKKIRGILQAIGKAFGKDFRTAEDVFGQVASGDVGNRSRDGEQGGEEKFKLQDPQTAEDRQKTMQGMIARGQPLDRALRLPFQFFGGVDEKGRWKPGLHLSDKAATIITTAKVDPQGRFGWLAGPIEAARAGLIDRYGLAPEYIERDRQRHMDERAITMRGAEVLKTLAEQNVGAGEARVLQAILTGEAVSDSAMQQLAAPIRMAIDELGQEAVSLGLISAESFERNRGAYLHRVYAKHESEQNNLQKLVSQVMGRKRKQIIGDELKGRGLFWDVPRDQLLRHSSSAQAMRKADSQIGGIETRIDTLASRREVLEGELKTLGREMAAHMGRRMDVADRATIKKMVGESRTTKPSSFQKGQVLEQAVALNRLRDRIELREAALDKLDGEIAAAQQRIDELSDHLIAQSENLSVTKDSKFVVLDKTVDKDGKERVAQRVYIPADEQVPERFSGPEWTNRGTWEARQIGKGKVTLWRDYSQAERTKMGEILDARYTIGKTYLYMAHDLATGRFYKDIAENEDWTSSSEPAAKSVEADQFRRHWNDREVAWVKVPDTTISDTGGKKRWGALSGKWVRSEIWRDLNEIDIMNRPSTWRMLLSQWKLNKTARSPVVHMNNVMSNLMLMDMQDVRMQDLQAGLRSFIKKDKHWQDANEHGVFGADMMTQEIRDNVLKPILDEIEKQGQDGVQNSFLARAGILGKFADKLWGGLKFADQKMLDAYRIEDDVFRLASYRAGIARGESPEHAAAAAREQFLDYDIRAPWVNAARNSLLPFISYTYRAVPLIARAMATRPWKLAKYAMVAYALNALAYAWDDDGDEDKERASLRDEEQGYSWLGTPRMLRMPFRNSDGLPVFLDVRRWIPGGDVFDTNQGSSALPIPAPLQFGGPLMLAFELALNKSSFTGDPITNDLTDNWFDKSGKVGDYLWKAWLPSAAWVPNSWYWTKIENAAKGATDAKGRPYSLPEAVASSVGIKLKPQDVETGLFWHYKNIKDVEQALRAEARTLARQRDRGLISQKAFDAGMQALLDKRDVLVEHVKELQRATKKK